MKGVHWSLWVTLALLVLAIILISRTKEGYAPPRDENTEPPYTEPTSNTTVSNQTQIYRDMGGLDFQIQAGNPILNFIQGDPSSNVIYGDFVPVESDGGSARMYNIETVEEESLLPPIPENPELMSPDMNRLSRPLTPSSNVEAILSNVIGSLTKTEMEAAPVASSTSYLPELTSPSIPFLGEQPGISALESPVLETSQEATQ